MKVQCRLKKSYIIFFVAVLFGLMLLNENGVFLVSKAESDPDTTDWYTDYESITLTKYNGSDTELVVPSLTTIEGVTYTTVLTGGVYENQSSITSIEFQDGSILSGSIGSMFYKCSNLQSLNLNGLDTSKVTSLYNTFYLCSSLTNLEIGNWDTSQVTSLYYTFYGCGSLTTLEIGNWDTSQVTSLYDTFCNCRSLTTLEIGNWDTSQVTDLRWTFYGCRSLTSLGIGGWDTSQVIALSYTFEHCSSLTTLELGHLAGNFSGEYFCLL